MRLTGRHRNVRSYTRPGKELNDTYVVLVAKQC